MIHQHHIVLSALSLFNFNHRIASHYDVTMFVEGQGQTKQLLTIIFLWTGYSSDVSSMLLEVLY